jgi:hypothetical protein
MKDEKYIKDFKDHSVWNRGEIHRELVECAKHIEESGNYMQRALKGGEKKDHSYWLGVLANLKWSLTHVEKHADSMRLLLDKHCGKFVSKGVEKRIKEIKSKRK